MKAPILTIAVIAGVAAWAMSGEADAASICVRCLTRLEPQRASISIYGKERIAEQNYLARVLSGGKRVDAPLTAANADAEAEFDFDSKRRPVAAGATPIRSTFIGNGKVSGRSYDAGGLLATRDTVVCEQR